MTNKLVVKSTDVVGVERIRLIGNDGGATEMQLSEFATWVSARYAGPLAGLPVASAANKLLITFITDSAASPVAYAPAAGGGSLTVPVYSDGTTWRNG